MAEQDGPVPAPRHDAPRLQPGAAAPGPPRVADLSALLADLDALRTTLSTDLSLAASALDAQAPGLAGELVSGDLDALGAFEARSLEHLAGAVGPVRPVPRAAGR